MPAEVDSFQFAVFLAKPPPQEADAIWRSLFGAAFNSFQRAGPGSTVVVGQEGQLNVTLSVQPSRIDIAYAPLSTAATAAAITHIPNYAAEVTSAEKKVGRLLTGLEISRVAFVLQASEQASSPRDAIAKVLAKGLQLTVHQNAEEVLYQTNAPVQSKVRPGIKLNRLCRWFSGTAQLIQFQLGGTQVQLPAVPIAAEYIDISNIDTGRSISVSDASALLGEITQIAGNLYRGGYAAL